MHDLIPLARTDRAIVDSLTNFQRHAKGAYSPNTERALRSDTAVFGAWCADRGLSPLPATSDALAAFVDDQAASKAPATIRRYVASIAKMHKAAGLPDPTKAEAVKLALKRMHREKGRRQKQAQGITFEIRNRMLEAAGDRLIDRRNKALLAVGYDTGCRRSELVSLLVEDVKLAEDGTGTVLIRRAKNDAEGEGSIRFLAADTVGYLTAWLQAAEITEGPLFHALDNGGRVNGPLARDGHDPGAEIARIWKRMAKAAGLSPDLIKSVSGHSARVGMAQDMAAYGIELAAIMQAGGWKTPQMAARYSERLVARRGGMAKLAAMQNRL
jgi:integrase